MTQTPANNTELNDSGGRLSEVPLSYVRGILQGSLLNGFKASALLEHAGLSPDLLAQNDATITGQHFGQLIATLLTETDDHFLGFTEEPCRMRFFVPMNQMRTQTETLGEFIRSSTHFRESVRNDVHYDYIIDNTLHEFSLLVDYSLRDGVDPYYFYWHRLLLIYRYYSWMIGKQIKLKQISFTAKKSNDPLDCRQLFNCEVLYQQPYNTITFDQRYLLNRVIRTENEFPDFERLDWSTVPGTDRSITHDVEAVLKRLHKEGLWSPTIEDVANIVNIKARTLRRHLAREQETFLTIKARVRCELAINLLTQTDTPITLIANQVGFAEPGDFTRAFLRWMNTTPSAYRQQHQIGRQLR